MDAEKLYEACYMQVYSYLLTLSRDASLAEELTQETFLRAMTAEGKAAYGERSKALTWLCAIGKNLFAEEMRRRKRITQLPENVLSGEDAAAKAEDEDLSFRLHVALHGMEEPYKEVFQLRVFGELSFERIGALFGKTENWARVTYHRARLKLMERMDAHE